LPEVAAPPTASTDLLSQKLEEQQKVTTAEEELEEFKLRQQLMAKEQLEIMRLEQQKLEIALAEAKSRLEQQDKLLRERQAAQVIHAYCVTIFLLCVFCTVCTEKSYLFSCIIHQFE